MLVAAVTVAVTKMHPMVTKSYTRAPTVVQGAVTNPTKMTPFVNLGDEISEVKPTMLPLEPIENVELDIRAEEEVKLNEIPDKKPAMSKHELIMMAMHRLKEMEDKLGNI